MSPGGATERSESFAPPGAQRLSYLNPPLTRWATFLRRSATPQGCAFGATLEILVRNAASGLLRRSPGAVRSVSWSQHEGDHDSSHNETSDLCGHISNRIVGREAVPIPVRHVRRQ